MTRIHRRAMLAFVGRSAGVLLVAVAIVQTSAASAAPSAARRSSVAVSTAGSRVIADVRPGAGTGWTTARLQQPSRHGWVTRVARRAHGGQLTSLSFLPASQAPMTLRVELTRGRRLVWRSRALHVTWGTGGTTAGATGPIAPGQTVSGSGGPVISTGDGPPKPVAPASTLSPGQTLQPGSFLVSADGRYELIMQADGNLVLYQGSTPLWSSGTAGDDGAALTMQTDGNLVIYQNGVMKWNSQTAGFPGASLQVQNDSNLVMYADGHPIWDRDRGWFGDELDQGWTLEPGAFLLSPDGQYKLIMQADGNLVQYQNGKAIWSSGTAGDPGASLTMQTDGNLVIDQNGVVKWNSQTTGFSSVSLVMQSDANLVIYAASHPIWDRDRGWFGNELDGGWTLQPGAFLLSPGGQYELIMQSDGNLVLYRGGQALWSSGTGGDVGAILTMQTDGNLVIYQNGVAKWDSQTAGFAGDLLQVQGDSNVVIYHGSTAIWDRDSGKLVGGGSGGGNLGGSIVSIAESQDQYGSKVADSPANSLCNPYTAYFGDGTACSNGLRAVEWCADFAAWAWRQAGVSFTYGGGSNINAWSASFYKWGVANGHWHSLSSGYSPQPGDVAVYGNLTEAPGPGHVGIYVSGSTGSPTVVNGDWTTGGNDRVWLQTNESWTGVSGGTLDGYVSP